MSHELEIVNGVAQMAYRISKGKPWHGLGTPIGDDLTPDEIMKTAGLDWTVSKVDTFAKILRDGEEEFVKTKRQALVRDSDGAILSDVGDGWNPVQNKEAFDFFTEFVKNGDMVMDTAGSLKNGQIVWALADLKDGFTLFGEDEMKGYLLFSNPHMYGKSVDVRFCLERVVCNNTLTMALNEKGQASVKVNHRGKFDSERVKEILGISHNKAEKFKEAAEFLGNKQIDKTGVVIYLSEVFGKSNKEDKILTKTGERALEILETQPGGNIKPGSFWQAFNTVTYLADHELGRSSDNRLASAWFGPNANKKQQALKIAIDMAKAA